MSICENAPIVFLRGWLQGDLCILLIVRHMFRGPVGLLLSLVTGIIRVDITMGTSGLWDCRVHQPRPYGLASDTCMHTGTVQHPGTAVTTRVPG